MSAPPPQGNPHDRVISITVAVVSLVLGVLPVSGIVVTVIRSLLLHHQPAMPPVLILVVSAGLIGVSVTIIRALRREEDFRWLGGGPLNYLLVLVVIILGAMMRAEANGIQYLLVRWGVRSGVASLLTLLPIIAGAVLFAVYWRRASAA